MKNSADIVYIALNESTDAATAIADYSNEVNVYIGREMVLKARAQFCMVNICWEAEKK